MAVGHDLQHIDKLYEVQTVANLSRNELQRKVDVLQTDIARLVVLIEQVLPQCKQKSYSTLQADQP